MERERQVCFFFFFCPSFDCSRIYVVRRFSLERVFDRTLVFCDFYRKKLAAELPPDLPPTAREIVLSSKYKRHFDK